MAASCVNLALGGVHLTLSEPEKIVRKYLSSTYQLFFQLDIEECIFGYYDPILDNPPQIRIIWENRIPTVKQHFKRVRFLEKHHSE